MPKLPTSDNAQGNLFGGKYSPEQVMVKKACKPKGRSKSSRALEGPSEIRFLTIDAVAKRYAISYATVWRWVKNDGHFPEPIKLSAGTSRWSEGQLVEFEKRALSCQGRKRPRFGRGVSS